MKHLTFAGNLKETYTTAILIKEKYFKGDRIAQHYVDPLVKLDVERNSIIAFDLSYPNDKVTATKAKEYLGYLLPALVKLGVTNMLVADAAYFKILTGSKKAEQHTGYVLPCTIKGFTHMHVSYCINYGVLMHNPNQVTKLDLSIQSMAKHLKGVDIALGDSVLVDPQYYRNLRVQDAQLALERLMHKPMITCDIETYGLRIDEAGLGSIAFSWNQTEGVSFFVGNDSASMRYIKQFFERYRGKIIYHNATFDIKHIIYSCFMKHSLDHVGMLHGLDVMTRNIHDTKIIAYLATNSTAGNELGLKVLAQPYLGNWGVDVTDITKLSMSELLRYNLEDCVGTYYVFNKYFPMMLKDDQESIYNEIMIPSVKLIVQMELVGMPMDMQQVHATEKYLQDLEAKYLDVIMTDSNVLKAKHLIQVAELAKINAKLKTKQHGMDKVRDLPFNPNSSNQLIVLLHEVLDLPVIDTTPTGAPSAGAKTIAKLKNHTNDPQVKMLLIALMDLAKVTILLSTFIPSFLKAMPKANWHYLHGSFNIGGTLSGRLSSSNPNMQNIPSGSTHSKPIKQCFKPPAGWLFLGADFASLISRRAA